MRGSFQRLAQLSFADNTTYTLPVESLGWAHLADDETWLRRWLSLFTNHGKYAFEQFVHVQLRRFRLGMCHYRPLRQRSYLLSFPHAAAKGERDGAVTARLPRHIGVESY